MPWLTLLGGVATVFGPASVLFGTVVMPHPELLILFIAAAFVWMVAMTLTSFAWLALGALPTASQLVATVVVGAVLQEGGRWAVYEVYARLLRGLAAAGLERALPQLSSSGRLASAAVTSGLSFGLAQALVVYGTLLPASFQPGGLYSDGCETLSLFGVNALGALGMLVLNVVLSLLGWTAAFPRRSPPHLAALVVLHALASGCALLNSSAVIERGGCSVGLPCLAAVVAAATAITAAICWRRLRFSRLVPS